MKITHNNPARRWLPGTDRDVLVEDLDVYINGVDHSVPAGFTTDYNSVPWIFRRLIPVHMPPLPPIKHDWDYKTGRVTRREADDILYWFDIACCPWRGDWTICGVTIHAPETARRAWAWIAWAKWVALRLGGWVAWNRERRKGADND